MPNKPITTRESQIQKHLCDYMRLRYPGTVFNSDLSGANLPGSGDMRQHLRYAKQLTRNRSHQRGVSDTFIYSMKMGFGGLVIEVKKEGTPLVTVKDGPKRLAGEWIDDHIIEQAQFIADIGTAGYFATFAIGLDHCRILVDSYMNERQSQLESLAIRTAAEARSHMILHKAVSKILR